VILGSPAVFGDLLKVDALVGTQHPVAFGELLLGGQPGLDPLGQIDLLLSDGGKVLIIAGNQRSGRQPPVDLNHVAVPAGRSEFRRRCETDTKLRLQPGPFSARGQAAQGRCLLRDQGHQRRRPLSRTCREQEEMMRALGYATAITMTVAGTALGVLAVKALPDMRRYMAMRKM
jgi:hypothetical protein